MSREQGRHPEKERLIAIGSLNPAKTLGVKLVFSGFFYNSTFAEVSTASVVKEQPVGMEEGLRGATERARYAMSQVHGDFGVGVEAGLFEVAPHQHINLQVAVIVDGNGHTGTGLSCGFLIPETMVHRMQSEGSELDRYARELTGVPKVREEDGIVYHLTKGSVSRLEMTEQCVRMALVPWLNRKQYGL
jgi:inosine/xanthosine triphosphatase